MDDSLVQEAKSVLLNKHHTTSYHKFTISEIQSIQNKLLSWYEKNERVMPWRVPYSQTSKHDSHRAYQVWISEVMLQQTQVDTVIPYYKKWMETFDSIEKLANADIDTVLKLWAGLGYYSRAKRLVDGAKFIVNDKKGDFPQTIKELQEIPGIGPYTAGAIASIAFNQKEALVDGNVVRVLSRLRALGMNSKSKEAICLHWELARALVDEKKPGHFNQALMDLGATICTPANTKCHVCPLTLECRAHSQKVAHSSTLKESFFQRKRKHSATTTVEEVDVKDIEDICTSCIQTPTNATDVHIYPYKPPKSKSKTQNSLVAIIEADSKFLIVQGPSKGLLASLYDFPNVDEQEQNMADFLFELFSFDLDSCILKSRDLGQVQHVFSHIKRTMIVTHYLIKDLPIFKNAKRKYEWVSLQEIQDGAKGFPATLKKAFGLLDK